MAPTIIAEVALPVFAFYLLVACNYVKEIFGCGLQNVLEGSMFAKHIVALLLLFFLVVIINPDYADKNILRNVIITIAIYTWFLMTTRTPIYVMITVLILLLASYIMSISKQRYEKENNEAAMKHSERIQNILAVTALVVSFIGFVVYAIEKRLEYKDEFRWSKFFSGNLQCKGYTPVEAKLFSF